MPVKNIVTGQRIAREKFLRSRTLRQDMTPAEKILWEELRGNKMGIRFRRQQIIAGFITDFYCHPAALVIELDGSIHDHQQEEDANRDQVLNEMGLRVVHFRNEEVQSNLAGVLSEIRKLVSGF